MQKPNEPSAAFNQVKIIGMAMVGSIFIYAGLVEFFLKQSLEPITQEVSDLDIIRWIFYGLAFAVGVIIRPVRSWLLSSVVKSRVGDQQALIQRLIITTIITLALCELIAIFGLVLFLIGQKPRDFYILCVASLILMVIYFPRYHQWENLFCDHEAGRL